jgi:hypothetical protein
LRCDAQSCENLTVPAVVDHLTEVIGGLERPPSESWPLVRGLISAGDWTPLDQRSAIAASKSHTLAEYAAPWLADRTASALPHSTRIEAGM